MGSVAKVTIASLSREIRTESDAYRYLEVLRWGDSPRCPFCEGTEVYFIVPCNGVSRRSASGSMSERRVWKCRPCRKQFSVLTNTVMHATKIPVRTWLLVIFDMCASKNGVSAREVERRYGVTIKTAWHMLHRIRQAMAGGDRLVTTMRGRIIADETWFGGDPRWMHRDKRPGRSGVSRKTPILSLVDANTGEVRSRVIPTVTGATLRKMISEQVDTAASLLVTDESTLYLQAEADFLGRKTVNHGLHQYVRNGVTTNQVEGFFGQFKRSVDGTHHHVSKEHLHRYLGEFDFRYSTCHMSDYGRMRTLATQMEGRLTYKRTVSTG